MGTNPSPAQDIKARRDEALSAMTAAIPFVNFLGISFERRGDELTAVLAFDPKLIGNPMIPALHGGVTAAFLEVTAIVTLSWSVISNQPGSDPTGHDPGAAPLLPRLPKTVDFTVDYLRSGLPRDAYARALISRSGRRYASVRVEGWQDNRARPFAQAMGHFVMPPTERACD